MDASLLPATPGGRAELHPDPFCKIVATVSIELEMQDKGEECDDEGEKLAAGLQGL